MDKKRSISGRVRNKKNVFSVIVSLISFKLSIYTLNTGKLLPPKRITVYLVNQFMLNNFLTINNHNKIVPYSESACKTASDRMSTYL